MTQQTNLIPAVGYIRRSTNKQEKSLDDQRQAVEAYAAQEGYELLRWYEDDGISGDATTRRAGFLAMHAAAQADRDFEAILCWDQDRFGRFNSLEAGYWIHPLMQAGVRLVTVTEGPIDWDDFTGRVMYSLKQEGKHQYLIDLSRNTARGQIANAAAGKLCGQAPPYGYDRMFVDEQGEHRQRLRRGEQAAKPRSWRTILVPSDDPEKVETVQWLFTTYAEQSLGLRALADELNERGLSGPSGGGWFASTIREILKNQAYVGRLVWAKRRMGKYHRVAGGEIKPRTDGGAAKINPEAEWMVTEDAHEPLVSVGLFDRVQAKLTERKKATAPRVRTNPHKYLLSGLVYCSGCGRKMHGTEASKQKRGRVYRYPKYLCSAYLQMGKKNPHGCGRHGVHQDELVELLLGKLREVLLLSGDRDRLREEVLQRLTAQQSVDPAEIAALEKEIQELQRQLQQGSRRLLQVDDGVAEFVAAELAELKKRLGRKEESLARLQQTQEHDEDLEAAADRIVDRLWRLEAAAKEAPRERVKAVLGSFVARIDLDFDHVQRGSRLECPLAGGTITLRADEKFVSLVNRGDRTPVELFLASIWGSGAELRRLFSGKSNDCVEV